MCNTFFEKENLINLMISSFYFSVCAFGLYENGSTCSPCLKLISGSGGENLIDGDTSTCSQVPFLSGTVSHHYELGIHSNCTQPEISVSVSVETSATCDDLRDTVYMEIPLSGCNDVNTQYGVCDVINENQIDGQRVCAMRCKCAESADQCMIHIFSGITPKDISICEITADKQFG